jgi:WD40 repeat protein
VALSEAGRWLAGSSGPFVFVWDLEQAGREPTELIGHATAIRELTFAGDGWLVSADLAGEIHFWRFGTGGPEAQSRRTALPASVWALATSAEHVAVGTGGGDESGRAYAWPLGEGWSEEARVAEHSRPVTALVFAGDGERLASGSADGGVRPAALEEGQWRALAPYDHGQSVGALAFAGDGTLAIGGLGGTVAVVDPRAGGERRRFAAHAASVTGMAFGADPSRLVTASQGGELKLWRLAEGEREIALVGHTGGIFELQADRAGRVVATAADDSSVRVWPLEATALLRMACLVTGRDLTADEWSRALPSHRPEPLCAGTDGEW